MLFSIHPRMGHICCEFTFTTKGHESYKVLVSLSAVEYAFNLSGSTWNIENTSTVGIGNVTINQAMDGT